MDTKDKAIELVNKYRKFVDCEIAGFSQFEFSKEQETANAKECALITVNSIIDEWEKEGDRKAKLYYWSQVKSEIEKLN